MTESGQGGTRSTHHSFLTSQQLIHTMIRPTRCSYGTSSLVPPIGLLIDPVDLTPVALPSNNVVLISNEMRVVTRSYSGAGPPAPQHHMFFPFCCSWKIQVLHTHLDHSTTGNQTSEPNHGCRQSSGNQVVAIHKVVVCLVGDSYRTVHWSSTSAHPLWCSKVLPTPCIG